MSNMHFKVTVKLKYELDDGGPSFHPKLV